MGGWGGEGKGETPHVRSKARGGNLLSSCRNSCNFMTLILFVLLTNLFKGIHDRLIFFLYHWLAFYHEWGCSLIAKKVFSLSLLTYQWTCNLFGLLSTHNGPLFAQANVERSVGALLSCFLNIGEHESKEPILEREKHIAYLRRGLRHLPKGFVVSFVQLQFFYFFFPSLQCCD